MKGNFQIDCKGTKNFWNMQIFGDENGRKDPKKIQRGAHGCARIDAIERREPRIEFLSHKSTITSGNGAKWAGGQVGAMRIMATMMSPKCTMRKGIKKKTQISYQIMGIFHKKYILFANMQKFL